MVQLGRERLTGEATEDRAAGLSAGVRLASLLTGQPVPRELLASALTPAGDDSDRAARLGTVRTLAERLRPLRDPDAAERHLPPVALSLLAAEAPAPLRARWAEGADRPRPGARPAGLRAYLWALASRSRG